MNVTYALAFLVALVGALLATPVARRVAIRFGVLDHPSARKLHTDPIPYLGGVAIIVAFLVSVSAGALVRDVAGSYARIAAVLGGAAVLALIGLWDDLHVVPAWVKLPAEIALAGLLYGVGIRVALSGVWPIDLLITLAWVVGIVNAVNYMDNMDGLTAGVSAIASAYFFGLAALSGQFLVASLAAALTGCAIGFWWWNRSPARIFMGDTGSLFLGFLLAALGLDLRFDNIARVTFFVPIAVMAVPILDTLMVTVSRVLRGLSPIHPGKDHISHRLVRIGIPPRAAVGLIHLTAVASGWLGAVIAYARPVTAYMLMGWMIAIGLVLGAMVLRVKVD